MASNPISKTDDVKNQYKFLHMVLFQFLESIVKSQNPFLYNWTFNLKYLVDWLRLSHVPHTQCEQTNCLSMKTWLRHAVIGYLNAVHKRSTCSMNPIFFS